MPIRSLTDAFVKAAKCEAGKKATEYRDDEVQGLELRVMAGGTKTWRLHYTRRSDGRRRAIRLGSYPALSLKDVRTRAKRMQADIEDESVRADPAAARAERKLAQTFQEVAEEYTELHAKPNQAPSVVRDAASMLSRHVYPQIGAMKAREVTKRDIIRLLDIVKAKPDGRKGIGAERRTTHRPNRVHALLRRIFRWAVGRDIVPLDPTAGIPSPMPNERARERVLSPDEIKALWEALGKARAGRERDERGTLQPLREGAMPLSVQIATAMKLALVTGQRIGEVMGISTEELELNDIAPTWVIPGRRTKNREPHRVPLSPLALELIADARALAGESRWLFPSPSGDCAMDPHAATRALGRARESIGLPDFRIHDLRRTAATRMEEMGVPPHVISQILNHVSVSKATITKKVYSRYTYEKEKREALAGWASRLERIVSGAGSQSIVQISSFNRT